MRAPSLRHRAELRQDGCQLLRGRGALRLQERAATEFGIRVLVVQAGTETAAAGRAEAFGYHQTNNDRRHRISERT